MKTLNLTTASINKKTSDKIRAFVYDNRNQLSSEIKLFYQDVAGLIDIQLSKPVKNRMVIKQILERAYNIDFYVLQTGAASIETQFA